MILLIYVLRLIRGVFGPSVLLGNFTHRRDNQNQPCAPVSPILFQGLSQAVVITCHVDLGRTHLHSWLQSRYSVFRCIYKWF